MSDILALTGLKANILSWAYDVQASSDDLLLGPASHAANLDPTDPWVSGSQVTPQHLTWFLNHQDNDNGGVENWDGGNPVGWFSSVLGGTVLQETDLANVHSGAKAAKITTTTGSQYALLYTSFDVPSSWLGHMRMWIKDGTSQARVYVQNMDTGNWLSSRVGTDGIAADWSAAVASFHSFTASGLNPGVYTNEITPLFRVEDPYSPTASLTGQDPTRKDVTTLRIMVGWDEPVTPGIFWLDDFELISSLDFFGVFYHNIRTNDRLRVQASENGTTFTDVSNFDFGRASNRRQNIYTTFDPTTARYIRLRADAPVGLHVGGAFHDAPPYIGECFGGQAKRLAVHEEYGAGRGYDWPQQRDERGIRAYAQEDQPTESRDLILEPHGDGEVSEEVADVMLNLYARSRGGAIPAVIVPDDTRPECYLGRFEQGLRMNREQFLVHRAALALRGFPPPTFL